MTENVTFCVDLSSTDASVQLGFEAWFDNHKFYDTDWVKDSTTVSYEFDDCEATHEIRLVLKNKNSSHTTVDEQGNIVKDALLELKNFRLDQIDLDSLIFDLVDYQHNSNGAGPTTSNKFFGAMGCNGTVILKFSSPVYLWLLENM